MRFDPRPPTESVSLEAAPEPTLHGDGREADTADTIVAISTAVGVGAIGIVRLSGPRAIALGDAIVRPVGGGSLRGAGHGRLLYAHVVDQDTGVVIDEVLAVAMRAPATYTREDVVEVHCHGGPAAQRAVLQLLIRLGARPAEPGEFTRRAFLHGRIDLTQAESVAAIVQARTASALRASVHQLSGGLSERLATIRRHLVGCLARLEAAVDFADEDIDELDRGTLADDLGATVREVRTLLETAFLGRALELGVRTAIVGRPNVGKSSLLNALLMRERAIVSDVPGTTRDTVEGLVEVAGVPLHLIDTAGLRTSDDHVERLGIERSRAAIREADLVLAIIDLSAPLENEDTEMIADLDPTRTIVIGNKRDKVAGPPGSEPGWESVMRKALGVGSVDDDPASGLRLQAVSALTGDGMDSLRELIESVIAGDGGIDLDEPMLATERQRNLTEQAAGAIDAALSALEGGASEELVSEDVREAIRSLGLITGDELVPDLIDEIFHRFCIGK
jgi:tRNA modification GTPase